MTTDQLKRAEAQKYIDFIWAFNEKFNYSPDLYNKENADKAQSQVAYGLATDRVNALKYYFAPSSWKALTWQEYWAFCAKFFDESFANIYYPAQSYYKQLGDPSDKTYLNAALEDARMPKATYTTEYFNKWYNDALLNIIAGKAPETGIVRNETTTNPIIPKELTDVYAFEAQQQQQQQQTPQDNNTTSQNIQTVIEDNHSAASIVDTATKNPIMAVIAIAAAIMLVTATTEQQK